MMIEQYPLPVPDASQTKACLTRHMTRKRESWEFVSDDVKEPTTFATVVTLDTLAPVILKFCQTDLIGEQTLISGWSYGRIDLGSRTDVDFLFSAPGDRSEGFVFRISPYGNESISMLSAYQFTDRKHWHPSRRKTVIDALRKNEPRLSAFEYRPQYQRRGLPLNAHATGKPFDPEGVLVALPVLVEAMSSFDPTLVAQSVSANSNAPYISLFPEAQDILIATRGALASDGHVAGPSWNRFVNFVWRAGMGSDLDARMSDIDGLASLLSEQGNISPKTEYDFDGDNYGAYVQTDGVDMTVFFRHEKDAISITRSHDRLTISEANYKSGASMQVYVDLKLEGGRVSNVNTAAPYRGHASSIIRRWVHEIEGLGDMTEEDTPTVAVDLPSP